MLEKSWALIASEIRASSSVVTYALAVLIRLEPFSGMRALGILV